MGFSETGFYEIDGIEYFLQMLPYGEKRILYKFKMDSVMGWTKVTKEEERKLVLVKSVVKQ